MIKTILATSLIALGMSAGAAIAQERTFTAWGHDFTTNEPAAQATFSALAPRTQMNARAIAVDTKTSRRARSAK